MYIKRIEGEIDSNQGLLLNEPCAVALGTFDGLHKGHMSLVRAATECARENAIKSCVFTFTGNISGAPYITSNMQRIKLLQKENVDFLLMHDFTIEFKSLTPAQFFQQYIIKKLNAKIVIVGFNYHFGYMGEGNEKVLSLLCKQNNVKLCVVPPVYYTSKPISSTRIRNSVEVGNLKDAECMLGREFAVMGKVVHGDYIGNTLGFPTANLEVDTKHVMPPIGVYVTKTDISGCIYPSITNYGGKPTIKKGIDLIETHILNYVGDLYGKTIEVKFVKKLRDIKSFSTREELTMQLSCDKTRAKEFLDKLHPLC